ncbi:hypothetical protein [Sphingomonas limnosediminicola]|uniref:hypothetical protein n=1 Tax=Sphingomonas limnosediminicola TaxID=940133 RepID=UPI0031E29550
MNALDEPAFIPKFEARLIDKRHRPAPRIVVAFRLDPLSSRNLAGPIEPVQPEVRQT